MVVGIIGAGNIGSVFAERLSGANEVVVYDTDTAKLEKLCNNKHCVAAASVAEAVRQSDVLIIALKPAIVLDVIGAVAGSGKPVISTAAAVEEQCYYDIAGELPLFRIMPTMVNATGGPVMVVNGRYTTDAQQKEIAAIIGQVGTVYVIPESEINAYMCVMSCSPAVFAEFVRLYTRSFCAASGIDEDKALATVLDMIEHLAPAMRREGYGLIEKVCTPGGISEVGVEYLAGQRELFYDMAQAMLCRTQNICDTVRGKL